MVRRMVESLYVKVRGKRDESRYIIEVRKTFIEEIVRPKNVFVCLYYNHPH